MSRVRRKLTFANVCSFLALVIALGTGGAYAANTIGSGDVIDESLLSQDIKNGEIGSVDLKNNATGSADVRNETLTGADIADQSGVDSCPDGTARILDQLCVVAGPMTQVTWAAAVSACSGGKRLPTLGEAVALYTLHNIPGVSNSEAIWTDQQDDYGESGGGAYRVSFGGSFELWPSALTARTVCVTTPTN
jgi:hypothetical protein